jgi:hypothetical protein
MYLSKEDKAGLAKYIARPNRYVRFVSGQPHPTVDPELGMFAARDNVDFSLAKGSIQRAHDEA